MLSYNPRIRTISEVISGVLQRGFGDEQVPGPELRKVPAAGSTTYRSGARTQGIDLTFIPSPKGTPNYLSVCNNRAILTRCSKECFVAESVWWSSVLKPQACPPRIFENYIVDISAASCGD